MQILNLNRHLSQSWLELPFLVDKFVQRVAPTLECSGSTLRELVAVELCLDSYDGLGKICRMMAEVYELLGHALDDMDVECEYVARSEVKGLAAAIVSAWYEGGEDICALEYLDEDDIDPMQQLPWKEWACWDRENYGVNQVGSISSDDEEGEAYEVLHRFMTCCSEWRQEILDSCTTVKEGTPVGLIALGAAEALIVAVGVGDSGLNSHIERVLMARGFYATMLANLRQSPDRMVSRENLKLDGGMLKKHDAILEEIERGNSVFQVRKLRDHFRWLRPGLVDWAYEEGPCMWQVLAHVSDDAYVEISGDDEDNGQTSICPFATVYVEREEDIAGTLRCTGVGATGIHVVTRDEALKVGVPQIAGWYAIRWWD